MLCGIEVPCYSPSGNTQIKVMDSSMFTDRSACRQMIGYCSQANPLWHWLTVEEHLYFYAKVKGVGRKERKAVVDQQIVDMDLVEHRYKRAGNLSGGNKRKLVVAMSMIGAPPIIFLDEPSAGMDPQARRKMWNIIQNIASKSKKSTVILTTHSMDECEALCSKVGIMTDGLFRCYGNIQRIKQQYGKGFDLFVKFQRADLEDKLVFMQRFLNSKDESTAQLFRSLFPNDDEDDRKTLAHIGQFATESLRDLKAIMITVREGKVDDLLRNSSITLKQAFDILSKTRYENLTSGDASSKTAPASLGDLNKEVLKLMYQRSSPFPLASRYSTKANPSKKEVKDMLGESITLMLFAEWYMVSVSRLRFTNWVFEVFGATIADYTQSQVSGGSGSLHLNLGDDVQKAVGKVLDKDTAMGELSTKASSSEAGTAGDSGKSLATLTTNSTGATGGKRTITNMPDKNKKGEPVAPFEPVQQLAPISESATGSGKSESAKIILEQQGNMLTFRIPKIANPANVIAQYYKIKAEKAAKDAKEAKTNPNKKTTKTSASYVVHDSGKKNEGDAGMEQSNIGLGMMFGLIECIKQEYHIAEYAITPTTLEQVFNTFARESEIERNADGNGRA